MPGGAGSDIIVPVVKRHKLSIVDPVGARELSVALRNHVVSSTESGYQSAFKKYAKYMDNRDLQHFPAETTTMASFFLHAASSVGVKSLGHYSAAVQYYQGLQADEPWACKGDEKMRRCMRYLKRKYPQKGKALKLSVSCAVLVKLIEFIPGFPNWMMMSHNDRAFIAASMIGVCGFLRGGEFLSYPGNKRPLLRKRDVRVELDGNTPVVQVSVIQPKNMWWLDSAEVTCFNPPPGSTKCDTVTALRLYWNIAEMQGLPLSENGPAFPMENGAPLSRDFMVSRTETLLGMAGIQVLDQAGKVAPVRAASWRAGGVRSAIDAGVSVPMIMVLGRWRSIAWESYFMQTKDDIRSAQVSMWRSEVTKSTPLRVGDLVPNAVFAAIDNADHARPQP